jgi:hypothetical protein
MRRILHIAAALLLLGPSLCRAQLRLVARTDEPAPGLAAAFSFFDAPAINGGGLVAFGGQTVDDGFIFKSGLWSEGDGQGSLRAVALQGSAAPTAGSLPFTGFYDPERSYLLNDLGDVAFVGELSGGTQAIYTDRERGLGPALLEIARVGQPAVDTDVGRTYNGLNLLAAAHIHSGIGFAAPLAPGAAPNNFPSDSVYNEGFNVVLANVAQLADPAPGTSRPFPLGTALYTEFRPPTINDSGRIAFSASTNAGASVDSVGAEGIWTTSPSGALRPVALAGQSAPGTPTTFSIIFGRNLSYDSIPVINDDGDVAFSATLSGLIAGNLRVGIWVERDGVVEKVAYESEFAPGSASTFERLDEPLIDSAGRAAFTATLTDGKDGLWRETASGTLMKLALQGEPAPGTAYNYQNITELAVSRTGHVAFRAQLSNFAKEALYETDGDGAVRKIVASDDVVELDGTPMRVDEVFFQGLTGAISAPGGGLGSGLNDEGQLAAVLRGELLDLDMNPTGEFLDAVVVFAPPEACLPADFDCDGDVDDVDLGIWRGAFNVDALGDADGDGDSDGADLLAWQQQLDSSTAVAASVAVSTAVPEPEAFGLCSFGLSAIAARRQTTRRRFAQ